MMRHRPACSAAAALAMAGILAACISERSIVDPTADLATCVLPLDALVRGDALVIIRHHVFVPDTVRLGAGRAVTWINCEAAGSDPHTSTATAGAWSSPLLQPGESWTHPNPAAGIHDYTCLPHPFMRGVVIVE